jgi:probable F420-dependent oxidoreductase
MALILIPIMKFGICLPIRLTAEASQNIDIAVNAEELGFDSVWVSDHVVMPLKHRGAFSDVFYDPFTLLAYIAAETSDITLGTSVIILPYRNPVVVAKTIATLDVLSGGRVIFGVGPGWMREEFETLGVPIKSRGRMTDEYIHAIRELWCSEEPSFKGEFCSFFDIKFEPKPLQNPHPPIWIAGSSDYAVKRAATLGDGWQPTWVSPEDVEAGISKLQNIAASEGRDLEGYTYSVRNRVKIFDNPDQKEAYLADQPTDTPYALIGTVEDIAGYVSRYRELGVSHLVFDPAADSIEEIYNLMETLSGEIIRNFR